MSADEIFEKAMATMAPLPSQESCARDLAAIFSFHLAKVELVDAGFSPDELPQQHAIMVAPTGSGKTYLLRHIAKACGVNVIFMDGSSMSRDGWKGASFGQQLLAAKNALPDPDVFSHSVVFVDEVDKMRLYGDRNDAGNVMDNLLRLFNAGEVAVEIADRQIEILTRAASLLLWAVLLPGWRTLSGNGWLLRPVSGSALLPETIRPMTGPFYTTPRPRTCRPTA